MLTCRWVASEGGLTLSVWLQAVGQGERVSCHFTVVNFASPVFAGSVTFPDKMSEIAMISPCVSCSCGELYCSAVGGRPLAVLSLEIMVGGTLFSQSVPLVPP